MVKSDVKRFLRVRRHAAPSGLGINAWAREEDSQEKYHIRSWVRITEWSGRKSRTTHNVPVPGKLDQTAASDLSKDAQVISVRIPTTGHPSTVGRMPFAGDAVYMLQHLKTKKILQVDPNGGTSLNLIDRPDDFTVRFTLSTVVVDSRDDVHSTLPSRRYSLISTL